MYAIARRALLDHLDKDTILSRYQKANGKEITSGKFANPESSAALAANSFGLFLDRPELLTLPHNLLAAGSAGTVELEAEMQFPWSGGLHPCLDIAVETAQTLIGIESKRYEPFRDRKVPSFSAAYFRQRWGARMAHFEAARDLLASGNVSFNFLDAAQLVKHAFGLRTQATKRMKTGYLVYLYAEPVSFPDGREIPSVAIDSHRDELEQFASIVAGDEIIFKSLCYSELLHHWSLDRSDEVRDHARTLSKAFDLCRREVQD